MGMGGRCTDTGMTFHGVAGNGVGWLFRRSGFLASRRDPGRPMMNPSRKLRIIKTSTTSTTIAMNKLGSWIETDEICVVDSKANLSRWKKAKR